LAVVNHTFALGYLVDLQADLSIIRRWGKGGYFRAKGLTLAKTCDTISAQDSPAIHTGEY
jgi:hypothetical protein